MLAKNNIIKNFNFFVVKNQIFLPKIQDGVIILSRGINKNVEHFQLKRWANKLNVSDLSLFWFT